MARTRRIGRIEGGYGTVRQVSGESVGTLPAVASVFPEMATVFPAVLAVAVVVRICLLHQHSALRISFADAVLAYSVLFVVHVVSIPQPEGAGSRIRPVPGTDLGVAIQAEPGDVAPWLQLIGNLVLLCPIGALLPMRLSWFGSVRRVAAAGLMLTCAIEFCQLTVLSGRVVSADDILLNTSGAVLGAMLSRSWWGGFLEPERAAWRTAARRSLRSVVPPSVRVRPVEVPTGSTV